jgi:hypothetical protein
MYTVPDVQAELETQAPQSLSSLKNKSNILWALPRLWSSLVSLFLTG